MDKVPPKKPNLLAWMLAGLGPGPGEPPKKWTEARVSPETPKKAIKCDMCAGISGGPAWVRSCPPGAALRGPPEPVLYVARGGGGKYVLTDFRSRSTPNQPPDAIPAGK